MENRFSELEALIVDDDDSIRMMLGKLMEREGFEADQACDGSAAIDKLRLRDYALILLDLMMPRVDGFAVLRFLREKKPHLLGRTVVVSALRPTIEEQVAAVFGKPFNFDKLSGLVAALRESSDGPWLKGEPAP